MYQWIYSSIIGGCFHDDADDNVGSFADIVMFYFIEVDLFNYKSKLIVLKELLNSMKKLGDNFNVLKINEFCQSNGIRFSWWMMDKSPQTTTTNITPRVLQLVRMFVYFYF